MRLFHRVSGKQLIDNTVFKPYYLSCETVRWFAGNRIQMEEKSREIKDIRSEIYEINANADLMEAASRFYLFDLCDQLFACIHQT